ncbi:MAG: NAD(P)H-dependent oxidoreductase [Myxococcota bacterium]|nr:NAD(P)H-dependent oxidoreductase [Myxococcota bacterium]
MTEELVVLGISGSLRKGSYNTALLRAAVELAPVGMRIDTADISALAPYNEDVRSAGQPPAVAALRDAIARADALLIATPEYNYSVPGVLKNAIDWASRPPNHPFAGKALAIIGASGGTSGTMRAQYHLRQIAVFLDMHPINKPELFVRSAQNVFDGAGTLVDQATRDVLRQVLEALGAWTRRLRH